MRLVLDAGGVSSLAGSQAPLSQLLGRGLWPAEVSVAVLTEALTGDHRRDFHVNRLLATCLLRDVDEQQAREAARLRTLTGRAGTISAVDAVVAALAGVRPGSVVLTTDPKDLQALSEHTTHPVTVATV